MYLFLNIFLIYAKIGANSGWVREAFQTKKWGNFGPDPDGGFQVSVEKSSKLTTISLILVDFVTIVFIFNLFRIFLGVNPFHKILNFKSSV